MSDALLVARDGRIAVLTMNRPDRRNALDSDLRQLLESTLTALDADPGVAAVILTGSDPSFCAGLDLTDLSERLARGEQSERSRGCPIPPMHTLLIAAVNGPAVTGGLELALRCHLIVASDRARFADTHTKVGLVSAWGMATLLSRSVGVAKARELSLSGDFVDAHEALQLGLAQQVVPHAQLLDFCRGLADRVAANDPDAVARTIDLYDEVSGLSIPDGLAKEAEVGSAWARSRITSHDSEARRRAAISSAPSDG